MICSWNRSYKYLDSSVNSNNSIDEEIKERIVLRNKAYYANKSLFKSKLISKKAELKLYNTTSAGAGIAQSV
jgi:hypothetical protein